MISNSSLELKLEIGHVLFIDIVGYSKLLINQQSEQLETLKAIVRGFEALVQKVIKPKSDAKMSPAESEQGR